MFPFKARHKKYTPQQLNHSFISRRILKKIAFRLFFIGECVALSYFFIGGTNGVNTWHQWRIRNQTLAQQNTQQKKEIALREQEINEWATYPFYQEKIAREQLQMANPQDLIYYWS